MEKPLVRSTLSKRDMTFITTRNQNAIWLYFAAFIITVFLKVYIRRRKSRPMSAQIKLWNLGRVNAIVKPISKTPADVMSKV